jgi:hypothetical protein
MIRSKRAVSPVISSVILASVTITLGIIVLVWSQTRSATYQEEYGEVIRTEVSRLKERLTLEYSFYDSTEGCVKLYFLNYGTANDLELQIIRLSNDTWQRTFSSFTLKFLNGSVISDQDLDRGEECYVTLSVSPSSLVDGQYYYVTVTTKRGASFSWGFVP